MVISWLSMSFLLCPNFFARTTKIEVRRARDLFRWTLSWEERDWKYGLASPLNHWSSTGESKSVSWLLYSAHDWARMAFLQCSIIVPLSCGCKR